MCSYWNYFDIADNINNVVKGVVGVIVKSNMRIDTQENGNKRIYAYQIIFGMFLYRSEWYSVIERQGVSSRIFLLL